MIRGWELVNELAKYDLDSAGFEILRQWDAVFIRVRVVEEFVIAVDDCDILVL